MLTAVVVAVALAVGAVVHEVAGTTKYASTCQFQLALPLSSTQPTQDVLAFNRRQAADEIARAELGTVFARAARQSGVPVGEVASDQTIVQASDSSFDLRATTSDPSSAVKLANALCTGYVRQLSAQLQNEQTAEVNGLRSQIRVLQRRLDSLVKQYGIHPAPPTSTYETATKAAISRNSYLLTIALSIPPYNISVLSSAQGASSHSSKPSWSKALIIAAAAGLLLSFLLILVFETVSKRPAEREALERV